MTRRGRRSHGEKEKHDLFLVFAEEEEEGGVQCVCWVFVGFSYEDDEDF